jgi:hypothetical protein
MLKYKKNLNLINEKEIIAEFVDTFKVLYYK